MADYIIVSGLSKYYNQRCALDNVSFTIKKGEIVSLLGLNAAGKTTLSKIVASLYAPSSGDIIFRGTSIYQHIECYRQVLGYCPQKPNLNKHLTLKDNLLFDADYYGFSRKEALNQLHALDEVLEFSEHMMRFPDELSEGWKQLYLIARTFMHKPEFVILDESTVGLDPEVRHRVLDFIKQQKEELETTFLITTHYLEEAETLADHVLMLEDGKVALWGSPQDLIDMHKKKSLQEAFISVAKEQKDES